MIFEKTTLFITYKCFESIKKLKKNSNIIKVKKQSKNRKVYTYFSILTFFLKLKSISFKIIVFIRKHSYLI